MSLQHCYASSVFQSSEIWFKGFDFCVRAGGKKRVTGVYVLLRGDSEGQNRLLWNALWQLFWKPGHVFLARKTSVLTRFLLGTRCGCWEREAPAQAGEESPLELQPLMILEFTGPPTSAWQWYSNVKQRCPGVRLAAKKVQAVEAEVLKEASLASSKGQSASEERVANFLLEGPEEWPQSVSVS